MNKHSSLPSPSPTYFLKEGNKISKKLRSGNNFFKYSLAKFKSGKEE